MNNQYINTTYSNLQKILENWGVDYLTFSIFDTIEYGRDDDSDWLIKCPDIESNTPVFEGNCIFSRYNDYPQIVKLPPINNPTWKDIIMALDPTCANTDHIFLENISLKDKDNKDNNIYFCFFGS